MRDYLKKIRETAPEQWQYDLVIPNEDIIENNPCLNHVLYVRLNVINGSIGVLFDKLEVSNKGVETELKNGIHNLTIELPSQKAYSVVFRNLSDSGSSTYIVETLKVMEQVEVDVSEDLVKNLPFVLKSKNSDYKRHVASLRNIDPSQIKSLTASSDLNLELSIENIYDCEIGKIIISSINEIINSIPKDGLEGAWGNFDRGYYKTYLNASVPRVYHLAKLLDENIIKGSRILDVGSFLGIFAIPLKRLGYDVVGVDRYEHFDGTLNKIVDLMEGEGIEVISVTADNEEYEISNAGSFDVVVSMAIIEHIPHTPRFFLENLKKSLREGGLFVLDTPNLTSFWKRQKINNDQTIMQDIEDQYYSEIPYTGHHREYNFSELIWIFEQLGYRDIQCDRFDANLMQFENIEGEHLNALMTFLNDASQMDTLLISGRK